MSLRCVIVDDNAFFIEGASDLLSREGLDIVGVASNGSEAVRLVTELRPDVALVDIDLGEEDGLEVARQLTGYSKVILISTHPESDMTHLLGASPAVGFIPKTRLSAQAILDLLEPAA